MLGFPVAIMCALGTCVLFPVVASATETREAYLPTGQELTPTAAPGAVYQRLQTELRPDGNAM